MSKENSRKLFVKCELEGKPAEVYRELKRRGIVKSIREAVSHGLLALYDQQMMRDLRAAQAHTSNRIAAQSLE